MSLTRRDFLRIGSLTTLTVASGCSVIGQEIGRAALPDQIRPAAGHGIDPLWRLLNRAGYGPRPGEYDEAMSLGFDGWIEQQLDPESLGDPAVDIILKSLAIYPLELASMPAYDVDDGMRELIWATLARQIFSTRQLYEVMVEFWSDHFAIYLRKNWYMVYLKMWDDREVIRPHALGNFGEMLRASVYSPAMLAYLDNIKNFAAAPNENYARELLELHTLGVFGGYGQDDVLNVARILSGLTIKKRRPVVGQVHLDEGAHDTDPKLVMGEAFPAGLGEEEIDTLIDFLVTHPSTAEHIATKLVRRFVSDAPPADLVAEVAASFLETQGDIKPLLRLIFASPHFQNGPLKFKRPQQFVVSALRGLNARVINPQAISNWLQRMGQLPFMWPSPDGYPDEAAAWVKNQLPRWNFATALAQNRVNGVQYDLEELVSLGGGSPLSTFASLLLGRELDAADRELFTTYLADGAGKRNRVLHGRDVIGLLLAGPDFQVT